MKGYIQVYTGNGKGKTTAAFGLALRAAGAGKKVFIAQFAKGKEYSELHAVRKFLPSVTIKQYGSESFITDPSDRIHIDSARKGLEEISVVIMSGKYDIVILDEANIAVFFNFFSATELVEVLKHKPEAVEIVITGRYAFPEVLEIADLVTEMKEVKHYYSKGVEARIGIEC